VGAGPWLASRHFFGSRNPNISDPVLPNCGTGSDCAAGIKALFGVAADAPEFLVATVPDPLHTHLGLFTDSSIQSIGRAASGDGWDFATQWLPWSENVNPDEKDPLKRRDQSALVREREKQPGLLVFRRKESRSDGGKHVDPRVLFVFLVGETPTAGIDPEQFRLALEYTHALGASGQIRVMGPTFSGSFQSLGYLLATEHASHSAGGAEPAGKNTEHFIVRSGTATSADAAESFRSQTASFADFAGAIANTRDQSAFFQDIRSQFGIPGDKTALLVEEESGYGRAVAQEAGGERASVRVFSFPRDIAHLRNAYRDAVASSKGDKGAAPTPSLDFSLKDTQSGEDSIATFSPAQTPLAQSAVLSRITSAIRDDGIQLVQINATNVLDLLFLARLLRHECPDARLMTANADLLFVEAARDDPLQGMLAISTYPMFTHSVVVTDNTGAGLMRRDEEVIQTDANSEGVLNATALLLNGSVAATDYRDAQQGLPRMWLLQLGREGFSPVRTWPRTPSTPVSGDWFAPVSGPARVSSSIELPLTPPFIWTALSVLISLLSLALGAIIWRLWTNPQWLGDSRFDEPVSTRDSRPDAWRRHYIFTFLLLCICAQLIICVPFFRNFDQDVLPWPTLTFAAAGMLLLGRECIQILRRLKNHARVYRATVFNLLLGVVGAALWSLLCLWGPDRAPWFSLRAVELRLGTSPVWPVLSATAALSMFALAHVTRLFMAVYQEPEIITENLHTPLQPRFKKAHDSFRLSLLSFAGFWTREQIRTAVRIIVACLVLLGLFGIWRHFRTVDGPLGDWLAIPLQAGVLISLLLSCGHIFILWDRLHSFLVVLETLPLAQAFRSPNSSGDSRPIWVRHLNLQSLDIHLRKQAILHDLALVSSSPEEVGWCNDYTRLISDLVSFEGKTRREVLTAQQTLRKRSTELSREMMSGVIAQLWRSEPQFGTVVTLPEAGHGSPEKPAEAEKPAPEPGDLQRRGQLAEMFVAFHYTSFLIYGVRQIQNLMLFLSAGSVLLTISLTSYNLQSPRLVGRLLLVLLVGIGVVMWKCLAGMERDPILSRINGSTAGELNSAFYFRLAGYGALPLMSLLASQFPSISGFLLSWVAPTLEAFK